MARTIIYDLASRAILVIDPALDAADEPILPGGVASASAQIADIEAAKLSTPSAQFLLAPDGLTVTVTTIVQPPDPVLQQHVADAVTLLNSSVATQTQANRDALARTIGVKPLAIPLTQVATTADIQVGTA